VVTHRFDTLLDGTPLPSMVVMHVGNAWEEVDAQGREVVRMMACTYDRFDLELEQ
jgi:carotenoid cleavage dioxygenase-like enzyme